jgi:iron-sulfur cluster assembly protein
MISVTDSAQQQITKQLQRRGSGVGIAIGVRTTGCSGLAYTLEYVDSIDPDFIGETRLFDKFIVQIDAKSLVYFENLEIDYVRQGLNEGFEFRNSAEKDRCGCGESFRI